ncbi:trigger factor [Arenimonas caeni]|uniref:Trigger factor n=1 Tax=Arenimonas caeni TaxID=2058085 RepID=A0A2P6MD04_9GAMM|nr:trigger factor [Arenimonas caeni]PRH83873.1 trigger factor [Arenimonas caeni]
MQVSLENTANLERRLTVSLPADRLEGVVGNRLRELARTANIKGFRKGKVPTKVIEQRFGAQVRNEAYGELVRDSLGEAIRQQDLKLAGNPDIKAEPDGEAGEIRFTATFEIVPDFGTIDPATLQIERVTSSIEESDIDTMIETLRQQRRQFEVVERAAEPGDMVQVETFAETDAARVPAEGAERGATVIGSNVMYPELESRLAGMKAGEEAQVEVTFPENWRVADLAGKPAKVTLKVLKVSTAKLPEVDAAFIKSFGIKSGKLEVFRQEVRANLERELKGNLAQRLRAEVASKLVEAYKDVELPPRLIEAEARGMAANAAQQARQQGQANASFEAEQFMGAARKRVAAALLVGEVARQNELRLDNKRLTETLQLIASTYEDPAQVVELYRNDANLMAGLRNRVMEEQVIDWIAERAQSNAKAMSFAELMRPAS